MSTFIRGNTFSYSVLSEFTNVILNSVSSNTTHLSKFSR